MPTYQEYQDQIAKLQSLAEAARQDEIAGAKQQIRDLMVQHGISLEDLREGARRKPGPKKGPAPAKYKDPATGKTWSGRGREPLWLSGKNKSDFELK